jgi:hypothetical protein
LSDRAPKQIRLTNGKEAEHGGPLRAPKGCSEACYGAETDKDKCKCSCGGINHGVGRVNRLLIQKEA